MAQWKIYDQAKRALCDGTVKTGDAFAIALADGSSNAGDLALELLEQVTGLVGGSSQLLQDVAWDGSSFAAGPASFAGPIVEATFAAMIHVCRRDPSPSSACRIRASS